MNQKKSANKLEILADRQVVISSNHLQEKGVGKKIAYCVGGGIAAVEAVKNIRELRRHGAEVTVYMSESAIKFITPLSLEWASGHPVVTAASGSAGHIFNGDGLVLAPATANTISKVASGVSDGLITGLIASALGMAMEKQIEKNLPIIFFPTMHESLYNNPFFQKNLQKIQALKQTGQVNIKIFHQNKVEGKIKIPSVETFVAEVIRIFSKKVDNKNVLITGGMVPSYLDQIRFVSNVASGETAISLAKELYLSGFTPTILVHQGVNSLVNFLNKDLNKDSGFNLIGNIKIIPFKEFVDYQKKVLALIDELDPVVAVFTAGVSDFKSQTTLVGKRPSTENWSLDLVPNQKVVAEVRKKYPNLCTVAFKLISKASHQNLYVEMNKLLVCGHSIVVGNILEELNTKPHHPKRYVVKKSDDSYKKLGYELSEFPAKVEVVNTQSGLAEKIISLIK